MVSERDLPQLLLLLIDRDAKDRWTTSGEFVFVAVLAGYQSVAAVFVASVALELVRSFSPSSISASGHVRVTPTLQLTDSKFGQIYAAGDLVDLDAIKNARAAFEQAQIVAQNIVRSIKGRKLLEYHSKWWEGTTKLTLGLVSYRYVSFFFPSWY